jgi:hypothetical protein
MDFDFDHTINKTIYSAFNFCSVINDSSSARLRGILDLSFHFSISVAIEVAYDCESIGAFKPQSFTDLIARLKILRTEIREQELSREQRRDLITQVQILWCEGLQLDMEMLCLSTTETEALEKYFYAYELVVRCKEASAILSSKIWLDIEYRMLTATSIKQT